MDTMPSTEPHHPSHMPTVLFGRGLTMGYPVRRADRLRRALAARARRHAGAARAPRTVRGSPDADRDDEWRRRSHPARAATRADACGPASRCAATAATAAGFERRRHRIGAGTARARDAGTSATGAAAHDRTQRSQPTARPSGCRRARARRHRQRTRHHPRPGHPRSGRSHRRYPTGPARTARPAHSRAADRLTHQPASDHQWRRRPRRGRSRALNVPGRSSGELRDSPPATGDSFSDQSLAR